MLLPMDVENAKSSMDLEGLLQYNILLWECTLVVSSKFWESVPVDYPMQLHSLSRFSDSVIYILVPIICSIKLGNEYWMGVIISYQLKWNIIENQEAIEEKMRFSSADIKSIRFHLEKHCG